LVKKEKPMMKGQTKNLIGQVRGALLALPDTVLMETFARWLDGVDAQLLDWSDECRYALGYRIQSNETGKIYGSFEELERAEPDGVCASWMVPDTETLRTVLGNLSIEQFYHTVIALASEALADQASEEAWGSPPSLVSDGYDFMRCLAVHLRSQALYRPEPGRMFFPQQTTGRRKPMEPKSPVLPGWRLRSSRHRESASSLERHTAGEITKAVQPHTDQPTKEP
jgi:hypothetical protein